MTGPARANPEKPEELLQVSFHDWQPGGGELRVTAAPPPHVGPVGASLGEVGGARGPRRPLGLGGAPRWACSSAPGLAVANGRGAWAGRRRRRLRPGG